MKKNNLLILVSIILFSLQSCGSEKSNEENAKEMAESVFEKITGNDIDIDVDEDENKGTITIKGDNGEEFSISGNQDELPDDFPSDFYLVKGEINSVSVVNSSDGKVVTFGIKTAKDFSDVKELILKKMKSKDWENNMTMGAGEESMQMFTKDKKSATINISRENDTTIIAYMATYKIK